MSPISYNPNASNASDNFARAMEERGSVERGGNAASVPQGIRAKVFQPAKASTLGRDIRAGVVFGLVVFGACCALFALHII